MSIAPEAPLSMRIILAAAPRRAGKADILNSTVRGLPQPILRLPIVSRRSRELAL